MLFTEGKTIGIGKTEIQNEISPIHPRTLCQRFVANIFFLGLIFNDATAQSQILNSCHDSSSTRAMILEWIKRTSSHVFLRLFYVPATILRELCPWATRFDGKGRTRQRRYTCSFHILDDDVVARPSICGHLTSNVATFLVVELDTRIGGF